MALRFDIGSVSNVERTDNGYLRCDGAITRTGVFSYRNADGSVRRELRIPDEVFAQDAMASFALAPLTNDHPRQALDAGNTAKFQVGTIANPRQEDDKVTARVQVTDVAAIADIESGKTQLSCGYNADVEVRSGVTMGILGVPDGLRFDAIQRNIRGNHVALVDVGRAGPDVALRLDHDDAAQINDSTRASAPTPEVRPMEKLTIDGITVEVSEQAAQVVNKAISSHQDAAKAAADELAALRTELETERARADQATDDLTAEKKAHADAVGPEAIRTRIDARLSLERQAVKVLGAEAKIDGLSDDELRAAVVVEVAADPEAIKKKLDGCDPAYLSARFDAAMESHGKNDTAPANPALAALRRDANTGTAGSGGAGEARKRMIVDNHNLGRESLTARA